MSTRANILVVDDVPENVEVVGEALSRDYDIQCAFSGAEALELLAQERPDLIMLDVMMPEMDGYEVLRRLKDAPATRDIPVIFVTARNDARSESEALTAGAVDFIHKPINADVVRSRVRLHLALKARQQELLELNTSLEARVAQRTRDLELSIHNLKLAKEAADAANRAKTSFLANMSHELRTPMNAIIGLTALLRRKVSEPANQDKLVKVERAAMQLLGLLNQVLDLTKIEAEHLSLEEIPFRLGILPENLDSLFAERAREKHLAFTLDMDPALARQSVMGDPLRLQQIVANLVANAIKFTERGFVRVAMSALDEGPQLQLRVEVQDSGVGISPEALERIFSPFEQADSSTTRQFGGTGLGLAISRRIAGLMGGGIQVSSPPGQGSTFTCQVRLSKSLPQDCPPTPSDDDRPEGWLMAHHQDKHLLLVEDEAINREITLELLVDIAHLQVDVATDGRDALARAGRRQYDLVLMDVQLPLMDGYATTRALRELPAYSNTPILALTANAFDQDRRACLAAGMSDFLSKPVDPDLLFSKLRQWLE